MKTTLHAIAALAAIGFSLGSLAACDRKPSPTPPKPTTTRSSALAPANIAPPPAR